MLEKKSNTIQMFSGYTDVYYWNRDSKKFITINQGGTSSSKTYSIMQVICNLAIEKKRIIHVVSESWPNLERGALTDFKRLIGDSEILRAALNNHLLKRGPFTFINGSELRFVTVDTSQNAKSGKRDILFLNEANGISYEIATELISRTQEKVFVDYNPNAKFWVHYELLNNEDTDIIISNYTHNKFCPEVTKKQVMEYKYKADTIGSTYWQNKWRVYGLGLTGAVDGVVFDNIHTCSLFPMNAKHVTYGLDFGFKNNHTALVKIGVYDKAVYGKELLYEQRLNSFQLVNRLLDLGITRNDKIIADPAGSEAISILQSKGFNVFPAKKGPDSIKAGIEMIQSMPLYITKDSTNWLIEAENYKYKPDTNGKFTNTPDDSFNDCWDGCRYVYAELFGVRTKKPKMKSGSNNNYSRKFAKF